LGVRVPQGAFEMTFRRYYDDSYTSRFTSRITDIASLRGRPAAILDETFFYPTSGGQPHDTGRLGGAGVVDVAIREEDGAVLHLLDTAAQPGPIEAEIDWPRRFDHMQQHTGQHILSQAFIRIADAPTIGFHLGGDTVSIDLGIPSLGDAKIAEAESLANQVVTGNAAVRAWFPSDDELGSLPLRKTPDMQGPIRVVAIGDFDLSACGGTHVAASGEIGLVSILRTERLKRGVRIEFLSGARARTDYRRKHAILRDIAASLTCSAGEVGASVERLQGALQEARRQLATYQERELDAEAERLVAGAEPHRGFRLVRMAWADRPIDEVKALALRLTGRPGMVALLGVAGHRAQLLFGRSEDLSIELKDAFHRALEALGGGRGGGARMLQGAAGPADLPAIEAALQEAGAAIGTAGP